ncbi:hypothetical protein CXG81DRAFT_28232 [Caulochytrium protostelioides]|uniref:Uncharacterized protein n=1 Tax=Caulochytrium protostelioides TaxID=1555241 RepID=A0A4P9WZL4_9FUNG|nr:hypothetical protein CXG81DRAFT_28232 [Caulochytrium protostelioides]|eukprot:RKO98974.1 hypothetical protein CXG81DRAFT_28232 [Caulochytrium protostelioides]
MHVVAPAARLRVLRLGAGLAAAVWIALQLFHVHAVPTPPEAHDASAALMRDTPPSVRLLDALLRRPGSVAAEADHIKNAGESAIDDPVTGEQTKSMAENAKEAATNHWKSLIGLPASASASSATATATATTVTATVTTTVTTASADDGSGSGSGSGSGTNGYRSDGYRSDRPHGPCGDDDNDDDDGGGGGHRGYLNSDVGDGNPPGGDGHHDVANWGSHDSDDVRGGDHCRRC